MLEYLGFSFLYAFCKDAIAFFRGRRRRLTPEDVVKLRLKWKTEFEAKLNSRRAEGSQYDVIIRDMRRIDKYPDTVEKERGISSWFKVGLMGTYHRGILAGLRWETIIEDGGSWRPIDWAKGERDGRKVITMGYIPYEGIENVDWNGDEYYGLLIIYCHFDGKRGEPYENLAFCEENCTSNGFKFYTEIASCPS